MARVVAIGALLLAAQAATASTAPERVNALMVSSGGGTVVELDARTLKQTAPAGVRLPNLGPWAFSPDRATVAVATGYSDRATPVRLRLVDLATRRRVASILLGRDPQLRTGWIDPVVLVAWSSPRTVVVLRRLVDRSLQLVTVDAVARRVVRRQPFVGEVLQHAQSPEALVVLVGEAERIVAPRLVVIRSDGSVRSVALARLRAGWTWDGNAQPPVGQQSMPGLAVDGGTAYLVAPGGTVASVGLDDLAVRYQERGTLAKYLSGSVREAVSLGGGLLAVSGSDYELRARPGADPEQRSTPAGLELVDVRTGERIQVDSSTRSIRLWADALLAEGDGLTVYDREGRVRSRMLKGSPVWVSAVSRGIAYAYDEHEWLIVDLAAGTVVGRRSSLPTLLVP
jgi:hypothetical protein